MPDRLSLPLFDWAREQISDMVEEHRRSGGVWLGNNGDIPTDVLLVGLETPWNGGPCLKRDFLDAHLLPDGLFVGGVLVRGSLEPLVQFGICAPPPLPDFGEVVDALAKSRLALSVATADMLTLTFPSLRRAGEVLSSHGFHVSLPQETEVLEEKWRLLRPRDDGRLEVDFPVAFISGFREAPGQPIPLLPGGGVRVKIDGGPS